MSKVPKKTGSAIELDLEDLNSDVELTIQGPLLAELAEEPRRDPTAHDEDGNLIKGLAALALPVEVNELAIREIVENRETARAESLTDQLSSQLFRGMYSRGRDRDEFAIDNISAFFRLRYTDHGPEIVHFTKVDKFQRYEELEADGEVSVKELAHVYRTNIRRCLRRLAYLQTYQEEVTQVLDEIPPVQRSAADKDLDMLRMEQKTTAVRITLLNLAK